MANVLLIWFVDHQRTMEGRRQFPALPGCKAYCRQDIGEGEVRYDTVPLLYGCSSIQKQA